MNTEGSGEKKKKDKEELSHCGVLVVLFTVFAKYDIMGSGFSSLQDLMAENPGEGETWRGL